LIQKLTVAVINAWLNATSMSGIHSNLQNLSLTATHVGISHKVFSGFLCITHFLPLLKTAGADENFSFCYTEEISKG